MDMKIKVIDEIALSGLQGLTIPKLWQRLMDAQEPLLKSESDEDLKNFLWSCILQCEEVEFFWHNPEKTEHKKIPKKKRRKSKPAEDAVKGDPNDSCGGAKLPKDWISDPENEICGYCPGYHSRENVTVEIREKKISYSEAYSRWQDGFVIVASQDLRRNALYGNEIPSDIGITDLRFVFLELIGIGRHHGFLQKDFKDYGMDARSSFHQIKILSQQGLITRQKYQMRGLNDNNIQTNMLFLTRFHQTMSSESNIYSGKLCEILSKEPGCVMDFSDLKEAVNCSPKLFKRIRAQLYANGNIQYIQKDKILNYSQGDQSLMRKLKSSQPILVQLIKEFKVAEKDDDNDDEEDNYVSKCKYLDPQVVNEIHLNQQMYWLIESSKNKGMTVKEFGTLSCMPYPMVRSFARNLDRKNYAKVLITDKAKQKVHTLVATDYILQSEVVKQINKEFDRAEDLTQPSIEDKDTKDTTGMSENITETEENSQMIRLEDRGNKQFIKNLELKPVNERKNDTVRGLKRKNFVLEKVKELRIIEGANAIFKAVAFYEKQQGIKEKVCRKSVHRILKRMVEENLIKKYEIVMQNSERKADITYYCDPSVSIEDDEFKNAVNETKFRLKGLVAKRELKEGKVKENVVLKKEKTDSPAPNNMSLMDYVDVSRGHETETDTEDEEYEPVNGSAYQRSQYGYLPRFPRLKMLHMYLWQLVYGNQEDAASCRKELDNGNYGGNDKEKDDWRYERYDWLTELVKLPSNRHGAGYFQTGDALAIMPVIIFTKCVGICMKSKTLEKILSHPKKRFTPLRDLPPKLKVKLFKTKSVGVYVSHFTDSLILMAHMGLLYTTPERMPTNRTQIEMLVSKQAMLVDTTQSEKAYSKTSLPPFLKSFPKLYYRFENLANIEKYWKDVQYVCLNTRLGLVAAPRSKDAEKKSRPNRILMSLRQFQEHFPVEESSSTKTRLFGDGLGAGGFDSTFFGHLAKNWTYPGSRNQVLSKPARIDEATETSKILPNRFSMPVGGFKKVVKSSVAAKASVGGRGKKRNRTFDNKIVAGASSAKKIKQDVKDKKNPEDLKLKKIMAARHRQKLAKQKPTKSGNTSHHRKKDATDVEATKRMKGYRVNFTPTEDAAILMVRITADLLNFDKRKLNYWTTARDILHSEIPETHDKTVEALARRGRYILKTALTVENMKSCVLECRADKNLDTKPPSVEGDTWKEKFKDLYAKVQKKYKTRLEPDDFTFEIPDTLEELRKAFNINKAFEQKGSKKETTSQLTSSQDLDRLVLEELIHNSLAGQNTKEYMPSLVFRIFDRYPASSLEEALFAMKSKSLVARLRVHVPRRRALPISTMSYSLSVAYERLFEMPLSPHLFPAAKSFLKMFREGKEHVEKNSSLKEISANENDEKNTKDKQAKEKEGKGKFETSKDPKLVSYPGTISYSKNEALGGHIACLLSLLVTDKAILQIDIPDNVVQCDAETMEKLEKSDMFSGRKITIMKRKMYANNLEEALEKEEDKAMEEFEAEEDKAIGVADEDDEGEDDLMLKDGEERRSEKASKGTDTEAKTMGKDKDEAVEDLEEDRLTDGMYPDKDKDHLDEDLSLRAGNTKKKNDRNVVTADTVALTTENNTKQDSLSFKENSKNTKDPSSEVVEPSEDAAKKDVSKDSSVNLASTSKTKECSTEAETGESSSVGNKLEMKASGAGEKRKSSLRVKEIDLGNLWGSGDRVDMPKKKQRVTFQKEEDRQKNEGVKVQDSKRKRKDIGNCEEDSAAKKTKLSGFVGFQTKGNFVSTSFFSDKRLIDRYVDQYTDTANLKQDFVYVPSSADSSGSRPGMDVVPSRAFGVTKSKLYTSRTTLMIHRSLASEGADLNTQALTVHEALNIKPLGITFHLQMRPFHDGALDLLTSSKVHDQLEASVDSSSQGTDAMLQRFIDKEESLYTEREVDCGLHSLSDKDFCSLMIDRFNWNGNEVEFAKEVLAGLRQHKELGMTEAEIELIYRRYDNLRPMQHLMIMFLNLEVAYCVGMYTVRYVSPMFVRGWSINAPYSKGNEEDIIDVIARNQHEAAKRERGKKETLGDEQKDRKDAECEGAEVNTRKLSGDDLGDTTIPSKQTGNYVEDTVAGRKKIGSGVGNSAAASTKTRNDRTDMGKLTGNDVAKNQIGDGVENKPIASEPTENEVEAGSEKVAGSEGLSSRSETEGLANESKPNPAAETPKNLELPEPLRSAQTVVHIKKSTAAKTRNKPFATILKVNKNKSKDISEPIAAKARIGHEAPDSCDTETKTANEKGSGCTMGHVLGPTSMANELGYKRATCKPWLKLNCEVNHTLFNKFHRAVLSFIMMCPGVTESTIYNHFKSLLRPMAMRNILQFLELNGCISKHLSKKKKRPSLFDSIEQIMETDFIYDDPYYLPNQDCMLNIADRA